MDKSLRRQPFRTVDGRGAPPPAAGLTLLDLGEGLYVTPSIGQMLVAMDVTPKRQRGEAIGEGSITSGDVEISLTLIGGKVLYLSVAQADKFLQCLGIRQPLVIQVGAPS